MYKFAGTKDASYLGSLALAGLAASPVFAGDPIAFLMAAAPVYGSSNITRKLVKKLIDRHSPNKSEGFILRSDETFPEVPQKEGLMVGTTTDFGKKLIIPNQNLMRHSAIIGQSGVGKTVVGEYLLWQQAVRGGGWLFIDAKIDAETRDKLWYMFKLLGKEQDFYVLNVDRPDNTNSYSPIINGDCDEKAARLLMLLPASENNPGSDYYRNSALYALTVIFAALDEAKVRYTFTDLAIMMQSGEALEQLQRLCPPGKVRMMLEIFLEQYKKPTNRGIQLDVSRLKEVLGGMAGRIAMFAQGKFGAVFDTYTPEIDLTDIIRNNKFLYVMLPTMGKEASALNLGKLVLSDLRTAVYNLQNLPAALRPNPPFIVFADEMGAYTMEGIKTLFEQARSAGICMCPAFQAFSQLNKISPDFADIIIQNTWNKFFFKFASEDSTDLAANIIGMSIRYARSVSLGASTSDSSQMIQVMPQSTSGGGDSFGEGWRETEEHRIPKDKLKAQGIGECILLSGSRVFQIKVPRLDFGKDLEEFKVTRHPTYMPEGITALGLANRYKDFLLSAQAPQKP